MTQHEETITHITLERLREQREQILALAKKFRAGDVRVFGSVARGTPTSTSDVDILVRFEAGYQLWDLVGLTQELEDLLGCSVDVVNEANLRPEFRPFVLQDAVAL